jgi:hypothetical protein
MFALRGIVACALFSIAVVFGTFSFRSFATPSPASGTLTPGTPIITYMDGPLVENPTGILGAPICPGAPNACSDFVVTINGSSLAATHNFTWSVEWPVPNVDMDIFIELPDGTLIANNNSTTDPSAITLPIPPDGTVYHLIVSSSVGTSLLTGTASLTLKYPTSQQGAGAPARYINYSAGQGQADGDNEPSLGIDWNPNVPTLQHDFVNRGGVAFFTTGGFQEYRVNFDDCSSPAVNLWEDISPTLVPTGLDPIGFVDHYSTAQLGISHPPPHTPGRVFALDLGAGDSLAAYSDDDGGSYLPGGNGGPGEGPDHESLGGGPFHSPIPTPPAPAYPNAIYYASQNGAQNAGCSRSDDGGQSFGPAIPMFNPAVCGGGIHGHIKVSPQGTVYIPNSSCAAGTPLGANGVASSTDNGITWTERNVPSSTGSQDPSVGIGQNNVGKPAGQVPNTIYLGWISADGHAHAAHSGDEGATWQDDIDVGSIFGIQKAVFAEMVAGDDNRAAYAFIGVDPAFAPKQVWHAYIANTYDGGQSWILVDVTPDDPVQIGEVCLLGIGCNGSRNLLDFNDLAIDAEGRALFGYTDGCLNCTNTKDITQSTQAHGIIARQSGGRRLFSFFDPNPAEPAPPAAPQVLTAVRQGSPAGVAVTWLKPDNGGSPITGYNVYRGTSSGGETLLPLPTPTVTGENTNKFLDQTADSSTNYYYRVTAVNAIAEGPFCRDVNIDGTAAAATACAAPFVQVAGAGTFAPAPTPAPADPTNGELTIQHVSFGEPFSACNDNSITFVMKVKTLDPSGTGHPVVQANAVWQMTFKVKDTLNRDQNVFVTMNTSSVPTPTFAYGREDTDPNPAVGTLDTSVCSTDPALGPCPALTGSYTADGTITIKLDVSSPISFAAPTGVAGVAFTWDARNPGTILSPPAGTTINTFPLPSSMGTTWLFVGGVGTGATQPIQITAGVPYTRIGNFAGCNTTTPLAILSANTLSGPPSTNFTFDGTHSYEPIGGCGVINSYTLNFGDGSAAVTNSTGTFSHTYSSAGNYLARLTVRDSFGHTSANAAQVVITVTGGVPPLSGVVSRKNHGGTNYDIILPSSGTPAIECRTGQPSTGAHTLIFSFQNTLNTLTPVSSISATAVTTTGGQPQTLPAPTGGLLADAHLYQVNLTGVPNASHVSVTLHGVVDSQGNTGVVTQNIDVLLGDVNSNGVLTNADVSLVKAQVAAGGTVTISNFRDDVNANGVITNADVSVTKAQVAAGAQLP